MLGLQADGGDDLRRQQLAVEGLEGSRLDAGRAQLYVRVRGRVRVRVRV